MTTTPPAFDRARTLASPAFRRALHWALLRIAAYTCLTALSLAALCTLFVFPPLAIYAPLGFVAIWADYLMGGYRAIPLVRPDRPASSALVSYALDEAFLCNDEATRRALRERRAADLPIPVWMAWQAIQDARASHAGSAALSRAE